MKIELTVENFLREKGMGDNFIKLMSLKKSMWQWLNLGLFNRFLPNIPF